MDKKFFKYWIAKRLVELADWDEELGKYYVEVKTGYLPIDVDEYKYLKKYVQKHGGKV